MSTVSERVFITKYSKAIKEGYAAVFVGVGLSHGSGYVDWKNLVEPFALELGLNIEEEHDYARIAQYYRNEKRTRGSINQEIMDQFSPEREPNESVKILTRLPIYTYWTTNYDKLLEEGLKENNRRVDVKKTTPQLVRHIRDRDAILYKMHGDYENPESAVLTKEDYEVYNHRRPLFSTVLQGDLVSKTFLFLGFSFEDPNLDNILSQTRNILDENIGDNYWLERKIQQPIYDGKNESEINRLREKYTRDITKQDLKINELQRYGIQTVLIDSYEDITRILRDLESIYLKNNVFISGSIEIYDEIWSEEKVEEFCFLLANNLTKENYKIYSGFGLGVGSSVINGALKEIQSSKYKHIDEHILLRPFPLRKKSNPSDDKSAQWKKYREDIIQDVGVSIFIFGNKTINTGEIKLADGVYEEFEIARKFGNIIIPVGSTGYMSKIIFDEVKEHLDQHPYLTPFMDTLGTCIDIEELVNIIVKIVKST